MSDVDVLVVAPQPFYSPRGTPFSVYYRTLVLAEQGARVDLLTYGQGADVDLPATRIVRIPDVTWLGAIPVGPSWRKLLLDLLMIVWTFGLMLRHRYPVVHAHEEAIFWCRVLKPVFRFRLVYDMHSSLPQQLSNFGFTRQRWLIRLFAWLEDRCLKAADAVITICPDLRDYALARGVDPERHLLIENSIFEDIRLRDARRVPVAGSEPTGEQILASWPDDRRIVLYAGTFEAYQGVDLLIEAFAHVGAAVPDARLVLAGGTPAQIEAMRAVAARVQIECVFLGRVAKSVAQRYTRRADVLVSPRRTGTNTPLKIYEQLASGRPLVATRIWSHTQVLTDEVCVLVEPDADALASGIVQALSDPVATARRVQGARALYEREYARPIYEDKIRRLLRLVA